MNMQVSYAKNPIQNKVRPHKIQVHLASNGSQRQTTLILIIKSHWRNTTPSHTHIWYFPMRSSSGAFWTTRGAIWDVTLTSAWFHGPGNGAWFRLEKRSRHVSLQCFNLARWISVFWHSITRWANRVKRGAQKLAAILGLNLCFWGTQFCPPIPLNLVSERPQKWPP